MTTDQILARVDGTIAKGRKAILAGQATDYAAQMTFIGARAEFRTSGLSLLHDLYGPAHANYSDFNNRSVGNSIGLSGALGILVAIREEVASGWLQNTRSLIAADLFGDFLEMADHLLAEGYKDAAAVIAGSSLEAHMRRLCGLRDIGTSNAKGEPKKTDLLNAELVKAGAYLLNDQKQVTAWLGIRNDAAHGHYDKVVSGSVNLMIDGIRHFITMHSA